MFVLKPKNIVLQPHNVSINLKQVIYENTFFSSWCWIQKQFSILMLSDYCSKFIPGFPGIFEPRFLVTDFPSSDMS